MDLNSIWLINQDVLFPVGNENIVFISHWRNDDDDNSNTNNNDDTTTTTTNNNNDDNKWEENVITVKCWRGTEAQPEISSEK